MQNAQGRVEATKTFDVKERYLNLPVQTGAPARTVTVSVDGAVRRAFDIELAEGKPDWWAFMDLHPFQGDTISLAVDGQSSAALDAVYQSDRIAGGEVVYREAKRPQLRFSARRGWLNDPNGLVFHDGEYHLFFQHNPYGTEWGNMHWGHAVSTDLVHWEELPVALYPDELGQMMSGSVVVDTGNTAGFQDESEHALIAIYTAAGKRHSRWIHYPHSQCIAVSLDRGRTWRKYSGNPVLSDLALQSRDPKVFWHAPESKWVMALYLAELAGDQESGGTMESGPSRNTYALFSSPDLTQWRKMSELALPDGSECPELFELRVDASADESRWIFFGGNGRYLIGSFDGESFRVESGPHVLSHGDCFYAAQTFNDVSRRILIPWGRTIQWEAPPASREPVFGGMPFSQSMGIPVELTLRSTANGPRLLSNPVRELQGLRRTTTQFVAQPLPESGANPLSALDGELWEIVADIAVGDAKTLVFDLRENPLVYDVDRQELSFNGRTAPLDLIDGRLVLQILVDRTAIDVFGNDGLLYMPLGVDLSANASTLSLLAEGGDASIRSLEVHELASIWQGLG
jgi:sucrose-6-phosphate hydrolase SacC (GH32 family)